jgi:uncharacterized protein (TIGR00661 family)
MINENPGDQHSPHILVSPLHWGLGHASRMIPLISAVLSLGCRVTVAATDGPMILLKNEFGSLIKYVEFNSFSIRYSSHRSQALKIGLQVPFILYNILKERLFARKMAGSIKPDIIISDNCYGFRSPGTLSVLVTHQLQIHLPKGMMWMGRLLNIINHHLIKSFDHCLVPDYEQWPGLAGALSHTESFSRVSYIHPLSRFDAYAQQLLEKPCKDLPDDFILIMLSGPEPQRSLLEELLIKELQEKTCIWFKGKPGNEQLSKSGNHFYFDHADTATMAWCIKNSSIVICRSGYSSVMDLAVFGKKCVFIPTPGQTEQEYLAKHLEKMGFTTFLQQYNLENLNQHILNAQSKTGLPPASHSQQLRITLKGLISEIAQKKENKLSMFWS